MSDLGPFLKNAQSRTTQLDSVNTMQFKIEEKEVSAGELFEILWKDKLTLVLVVAMFSIGALLYSLSLPNVYRATATLIPTQQSANNGLGGLASQYGGLAAMAGIDLNTGGNQQIDHAIELLTSWPYLNEFVSKYHLLPELYASEGWDSNLKEIIYDDEIYNSESKYWLVIDRKSTKPTSFETYSKVSELISIAQDKENGLIKLSVSHHSPQVALKVVNLMTNDINEYFKLMDKREATDSIRLLEAKIQDTSNSDMRQVFYNMIERHTQTLLMAEVNEQYLVKTLVPAMEPEIKDEPKRALICILGALLGVIISVFFIFVKRFSI